MDFHEEIMHTELLAVDGRFVTPWRLGMQHETMMTVVDANGRVIIHAKFHCNCNRTHILNPSICYRHHLAEKLSELCRVANAIQWRKNPPKEEK